MERVDVIVVGAGAAGLASARALADRGLHAVVLEARDRIGGRILTYRPAGSPPVELGAQVVHPTADPALADRIAASGLATIPMGNDAEVVVVAGGHRWDAATLAHTHPPAPWAVEHWLAGAGTVEDHLVALPEIPRLLAAAWVEQSVGGACAQVDVAALAALRTARARGQELVLAEGFDAILARLAAGLDVRLGSPVEALTWRKGSVRAEGATARAAVVTVPPSVVLAGGLDFAPALPDDKARALPVLASGDAVSVAIVGSAPAQRSAWALFADRPHGMWRSVAGSPVVVGHVKGPRAAMARRAEWSAANAGWLAGQVDASVGDIVEVRVQDWGADPWSCGAYSLPLRGVEHASRAWAVGVDGTLFFAGEATAAVSGRALVQGALSSGRRAAAEVAHALGHG